MHGAGKIKFVEIQSIKVKKIEQQTNPIALNCKMTVCLLIPRGEEQTRWKQHNAAGGLFLQRAMIKISCLFIIFVIIWKIRLS